MLGVTRKALNNLVNTKAGISPEMAIRLDKAFGGTAEAWLSLQTAYDLAQARKNEGAIVVKRYVPKEPKPQDRRRHDGGRSIPQGRLGHDSPAGMT